MAEGINPITTRKIELRILGDMYSCLPFLSLGVSYICAYLVTSHKFIIFTSLVIRFLMVILGLSIERFDSRGQQKKVFT